MRIIIARDLGGASCGGGVICDSSPFNSYSSHICMVTPPTLCSEVKKASFVEFYDYYLSTATKLSTSLDGQSMQVCNF